MSRRLRALLVKEFRHMRRDPRTLVILIVQPMVFLAIFGYALSLDLKDISTAWVDYDRTPQSRQLQRRLEGSGYFRLLYHPADVARAGELMDRGRVKAIVVVPAGFGARLLAGRGAARLQILLDGTDNTAASTASGYFRGLTSSFASRHLEDRLARLGLPRKAARPGIDARLRVWYNPDLDSTPFIVSGLIAVILMFQTSLLPAVSIVRERETGSLDHLILSPARPVELIWAKTVPYALVAFLNMLTIVALGRLAFHLPVRGSLLLLMGLSFLFILVPVGLGLFISTLTETQSTAMLMTFLLSNLPAFLLSGFVFPISSMPAWLQVATLAVPARHYLVILRGILIKGAGLAELWPQALALLAMGLLLLGLAARRYRRLG
ncbi:MAG TPA: ABC transporter permease [Candidatus Nitrosotenuis sp.]|jgi:ABC-2 type transport system permease protein|nr:ABC transporter permease [Candidatus Nitrosotenuis sp.]